MVASKVELAVAQKARSFMTKRETERRPRSDREARAILNERNRLILDFFRF